ncbi:UNVERIFIED_CONTAM: hypothetical protein Sradi_0010000 [Sesamum radiatum]|uniref:Uncharacterized protein n=1 Tax=Sesamum radiatum TaxID=300843 RepID=A0AAW2WLM2_SESRA
MLYWKDEIDLDYWKFCGETRYMPTKERNPNHKKTPYAILRYSLLTPRLQRLYASEVIAEQITWHANHQMEQGYMCHPSDADAWRHFDQTYPDFVAEPHNVILGLCIDGFTSHGQCIDARLCEERDIHDKLSVDVDQERPTAYGMAFGPNLYRDTAWTVGASLPYPQRHMEEFRAFDPQTVPTPNHSCHRNKEAFH